MIYLDPRDTATKEGEIANIRLISHLRSFGLEASQLLLDSGDACFEGNGPNGIIAVGIERKALGDMLRCIEDGRYSEQRRRMKLAYNVCYLMVEGLWQCDSNGFLMRGTVKEDGTCKYGLYMPYGRKILYAKLYNYLLSVAHSGVIITYPANLYQTAWHIRNCFTYYAKKWGGHTSLLTPESLNMPTLGGKPSLLRLWAGSIDEIGVKRSAEAERIFRRPIKMATADELDWLRVEGIGPATARNIVRQIQGVQQ